MNETIELPAENAQALVVRERENQTHSAVTPAQAKVEAVANLTMKAYQRASTLQLTPEEIKGLAAEFPDEAFQPGAAGKDHLIYVEHAYLRDRLNQVFGPGQWAVIPRNRWAEPFKTTKGGDGSRVYVEAMLVIRGCFVAEAVGAMEYYLNNASQNYGDAVEGAKTAALRRCAKELGIGLQAWKKEFGEGWWKRRREKLLGAKPKPEAGASSQPKAEARAVPQTKNVNPVPTQRHKDRMLANLVAVFGDQKAIKDFACKAGILLGTEELLDWPLRYVPASAEQMKSLEEAMKGFFDGDEAAKPFVNPEPENSVAAQAQSPAAKPVSVPRDANCDPNSPDAAWRKFVIPFGKEKGTNLGSVDKRFLYGFWAGFEVQTEYEGKPKKAETIAKDKAFRAALDEAGKHYEFTKKDE